MGDTPSAPLPDVQDPRGGNTSGGPSGAAAMNAQGRGEQGSAAAEAGRYAHVFAALDLGTNNCRLLVARPQRHGFRVIDAFSRIVRLGEGVHGNGILSEAAIGRTIEALKVCADKMSRRRVSRSRLVATEACRKAANCAEFLDRVHMETGLHLDIISTAEEARLALAGSAPLLDARHSHGIVFDIGGGSTEIMWVAINASGQPELLAWTSLPCGVVNLAERWGGVDIPPETYEGMVAEVGRMLEPFDRAHAISERFFAGGDKSARHVQMLGTSGTVTTIAGVLLDLPRYDRNRVDGCWLEGGAVQEASRRLAAMSVEERGQHPCVGPDRADLVVAGCAIFEAIHRRWRAGRIRVADRGVREGVLYGLMNDADREAAVARRARRAEAEQMR